MSETTRYSADQPGARGNYGWIARFDSTRGYVGISQWGDGKPIERVLLSPAQVKALVAFIAPRPRAAGRKKA